LKINGEIERVPGGEPKGCAAAMAMAKVISEMGE
jgi:hypothetical protein